MGEPGATGSKHPRCGSKRTRRGGLLALVVLFLAPQLGRAEVEELTEEEVYCEEAAALLKGCCGELPSSLNCDYRAPSECSCDDCVDPGQRPAISRSAYQCLDTLTCSAIVERGYCARLLAGERLGISCEDVQ